MSALPPRTIRRPFRYARHALPAFALLAALAAPGLVPLSAAQEPGAPGDVGTPGMAKAYAPERLWELDEGAQRRAITQEYSDQSDGRTIPDDQMRFYLGQVRFSRWTFSQVRADIAESLAGHGVSDGAAANTIRCESSDGRQRNCTTTWQGRSKLVRQLSNTACVEGENWSSSPGHISVSGGCRGEFTEELDTTAGGIRCESTDGQPQTCPMPWSGKARIIRQLSGTRCVANQNWWTAPGQVRVTGGCRALFASVDGETIGSQIRCESMDRRYHECGSQLHGTPRIVRELSNASCTLDRTFGLRGGKLWVSLGCRAIFEVADGSRDGYKVTCESVDGRYYKCPWDHSRGGPRLVQKLSDRECRQGYSWGYDRRSGIWVKYGCRAVFAPR